MKSLLRFTTAMLIAAGAAPATAAVVLPNAPDNTAPLLAALASLPANGGTIHFEAGKYEFSGPVAFTMPSSQFSVTLEGEGAGATTLHWPGANGGIHLVWSGQENSAHVRDMTITTDAAGVGTGLSLTNTNVYGGFQEATENEITRVTFQGDGGVTPTRYWGAAINISGINFVNITDTLVYGGVPGPSPKGIGIAIADAPGVIVGGFTVNATHLMNLEYGMLLVGNPQGVRVNHSEIVDCDVGIATSVSAGPMENMSIIGSEFDNRLYNIYTQNGINDFVMAGTTLFTRSTSYANVFLQKATRFAITGNVLVAREATGNPAIKISDSQGWPGTIVGNTIAGSYARGIELGSATSRIKVAYNGIGSTVTTPVSNAGSGNTVIGN